jgi:extracellular elastinolytic metalloproteinase
MISAALAEATTSPAAMGFSPGEPAEFVPDPIVQKTSAGSHIVHLQQQYRGIPVFQMARAVHFTEQGDMSDMMGDNALLPAGIDTLPQTSAIQAVQASAQYVGTPDPGGQQTDHWGQKIEQIKVDASSYQPQVIAAFELPSRPTVLDRGPFQDPIPAHLVMFYDGNNARLGWHVLITLPDYKDQWVVITAADRTIDGSTPPEILYSKSTMQSAGQSADIVANVFTESPGRNGDQRVRLPFPRPAGDYPLTLQVEDPKFPGQWCTADETSGNYTIATLGENSTTYRGVRSGDSVVFDPATATDDDQKVLNIFYFCNYMHDFFYLLGFDEAAGNFQVTNKPGAGLGNDPVHARAFSGQVNGTANMLTRPDGRPAVMNMGLVASTGRHTALDADVVFHEFAHGVTNRLVGGRMNASALEAPQSGGMGEGWGDYFALSIQNFGKEDEKTVTGDWVVKNDSGIRSFPYDSKFPDGFGSIGTGRYDEVHNIGEIWCATLMEMTRRVGAGLNNRDDGHRWSWQIVVDSLKLMPANPSFLDARDAMLRAIEDLRAAGRLTDDQRDKIRAAAWGAFAKFGMGPAAASDGPSLSGIVADDSLPPDLAGGPSA